jgi:hypothetical protein
MVGKNPLWVAKQHGHSIATMLRKHIWPARTTFHFTAANTTPE